VREEKMLRIHSEKERQKEKGVLPFASLPFVRKLATDAIDVRYSSFQKSRCISDAKVTAD
jgi:hypothetical protein